MTPFRIATFLWPEPAGHPPVFPVFLPFSGCPVRCVFCAQDLQTGHAPRRVEGALAEAARLLRERARQALSAPELAFYGGTFTALPAEAFAAALELARTALRQGFISGLRCSTRPDSLPPDRLAALREAGCGCVELGVQSFADAPLRESRRGYDGRTAREAVRRYRPRACGRGCSSCRACPVPGRSISLRTCSWRWNWERPVCASIPVLCWRARSWRGSGVPGVSGRGRWRRCSTCWRKPLL